jgi:hypothetical protein
MPIESPANAEAAVFHPDRNTSLAAMTATTQRRRNGYGNPLVLFRAPQEFVDALRSAASSEHVTVSEFVRATLRERLGLETRAAAPPEPPHNQQTTYSHASLPRGPSN